MKKQYRALSLLLPRQREILCVCFGIGMEHPLRLEEIAARFDISTERVCQVRTNALDRLRAARNVGSLREFL